MFAKYHIIKHITSSKKKRKKKLIATMKTDKHI